MSGACATRGGGLRLLVDARMWTSSGIGRVLRGYVGELSRRGVALTCLCVDDAQGAQVRALAPRSRIEPFAAPLYSWREQWHGARVLRRLADDHDACFFPHYNAPITLPGPSVVIIHDLIQFRFGLGSRAQRFFGLRLLMKVFARAGAVVAVSEATARDLRALRPALSHKVRVIHNGLEQAPPLWTETERATFRLTRGLGRYLLMVGNKKPHKNFEQGLRCFAALAGEFPDLCLVMVGQGSSNRGLPRELPLELAPRVHDMGELPPADLADLLRGAEMLLQPSWMEGFGLPPLEAMQVGVPVVASTRASLPEVCGGAALYADPGNDCAWIAQARLLLLDEGLRAALRTRGLLHARGFSWRKAADHLLAVIFSISPSTRVSV